MNCSQFQEILHDLDRPGTEGFAARDAAFLHAESCDRCTQLLTQSESLDFALRTLARRGARQLVPPRVEQLLLEELRQRTAALPSRAVRWPIVALGTAAALLLVLGLALHSRTARHAPGTARLTGGDRNGTQSIASDRPSQSSSTALEVAEDSQEGDFDSATGFVSLPYADDSMEGEGGAIVRVVLSRAALASLGLPVTDVGAPDRIPADIIVSEDGAPQAIRLVAQSDFE
jgi:hypothetical protein